MSIIFDEKGNAVGQIADPEREPSTARIVTCPDCGTVMVMPNNLITSKTKPRECPRCKRFLGEW